MSSQVATLRFAVKCSRAQHRQLDEILGWSAEMYNALLESWKGTYAWWREHNPGVDEKFPPERNRSRYDLFKVFTQVRAEDPRWPASTHTEASLNGHARPATSTTRKYDYDYAHDGLLRGMVVPRNPRLPLRPGYQHGDRPQRRPVRSRGHLRGVRMQ